MPSDVKMFESLGLGTLRWSSLPCERVVSGSSALDSENGNVTEDERE